MLIELRIENFAIIDRVELHFGPGLITFTGETGAGKSILIDAVETILGGRAESTMVRSGTEIANVEAVFKISPDINPGIFSILQAEHLLDDAELLTLSREIRVNGRNVARVNGHSVSVALLREIGEQLIDVHGQSEHLSLLRVGQHLGLLDNYSGVEYLLHPYQATYHRLLEVRKELTELRLVEQEAARRTDTLTYQINEIETARLKSEEEPQLREERNRLANAEGLAAQIQEAVYILDEGSPETPAVTDLLGQVIHALNSLARLDPFQTNLVELAQIQFDNLNDLSRSLRAYQESVEFNPKRLNLVEERLNLIYNLKRKYGDTIEAILAFADKARLDLEAINHAGERIKELEAEEGELLSRLSQEGLALSEKRHAQADHLSLALEAELDELQMSRTQFNVAFHMRPDPEGVLVNEDQRVAFDSTGLERVEFLIAPNPGEGFKPLVKIASGGETSRLMMALKNVLAKADQVPTLIFDEIDQGIGGRVGRVVGLKLWTLAQHHQVMCVTHLPQLAAFGNMHFRVEKKLQEGRTLTLVTPLEGENRIQELAQMLGGVSEGTLHSAREIMQAALEASAP
ncbi:MAG TPA: DNA repair protein RecN [Anaerolineales bacterium]|nr:DNA repair protein RecN [Anaerolineales bacterium]